MVTDFSSPSLRKINVVTVWPDELKREMPRVCPFSWSARLMSGCDVSHRRAIGHRCDRQDRRAARRRQDDAADPGALTSRLPPRSAWIFIPLEAI